MATRTVARQAPLSMEFSEQESWSGLPVPPPGNLLDSGIDPRSPALQADSLSLSHQGSPYSNINSPKGITEFTISSQTVNAKNRTLIEVNYF